MGAKIRADLMDKCNLHHPAAAHRHLPAQGVKTNVLFLSEVRLTREYQKVWVYDLRTNMPVFGKHAITHVLSPLKRAGSQATAPATRRSGAKGPFRCFTPGNCWAGQPRHQLAQGRAHSADGCRTVRSPH